MIPVRRIQATRRITLLGLLFASLVPVAGCKGTTDRKWSEEVLLDDGRVIVVERYVKFQSSNSLAGDAYSSTDLKSTLTFTNELAATPAWDAPLVPIALYRDASAKEWVIVATTSNCDTWYVHGRPQPPYWEFRVRGGSWVKTKLSRTSIGRKTNLFFNYEVPLPARKLSQQQKDSVLASKNFAKKYRTVNADVKSKCM